LVECGTHAVLPAEAGRNPDRVSFTVALRIVRLTVSQPSAFPLTPTAPDRPAGAGSSACWPTGSIPPVASPTGRGARHGSRLLRGGREPDCRAEAAACARL
jgi:hypothetical protein